MTVSAVIGGACISAAPFLLLWAILHAPRPQLPAGTIVRAAELRQYPEYSLYYPSAVLIGQGGHDAETGPFGYSRASAAATLGTGASQDEVLAYYARELTARGWIVSAIDGIPDTAEITARGWRKGNVAFRLGILRAGDPRNSTATVAYRTAFSIALFADDPRDPSWQTATVTP